MSDDPIRTLSSYIRVKHGFAFPGAGFSDDPSFPTLLTPGNFALGGGFKEGKTKTYSGDYPAEYKLSAGDLIINMTDLSKAGDTLGLPAIVPEGGDYLHNQRVGLVEITDPENVDRAFLSYFLRTSKYRDYILGTASGSTVRHTSPSRIGAFEAVLPPVNQQQAIVEVLGALDDKIAANTKLVNIADRLAASLTRSAVDTSKFMALSGLADIVMGSSPSGTSFNESGEGTVFYQGVRDFGFRFPSNRVWTIAPVRLAMPGDTLLSVRAPVGRVNLATEETCIGRGVASVRSSNDQPFTLFHLLKDSDEAWAPFEAEGTVFGSINKGQLASLLVPRLKPEQEMVLEAKLAPLERTIASALSENSNLAATRDTLLPRLMSGKLRVKDAEKVLENAGV